jgi:hypothetical protein
VLLVPVQTGRLCVLLLRSPLPYMSAVTWCRSVGPGAAAKGRRLGAVSCTSAHRCTQLQQGHRLLQQVRPALVVVDIFSTCVGTADVLLLAC